MKIFIYASYPTCSIGYARVANRLATSLVDNGHTVMYFGITHFDPVQDRSVSPKFILIDASQEEVRRKSIDPSYPMQHYRGYGDLFLHEYVEAFRPDILFIYNDTNVISDVIRALTVHNRLSFRPSIYIYLDLVYEFQTHPPLEYCIANADCVLVFSECWLRHLVDDLGFPRHKFRVLKHGIDPTVRHMDVDVCRKHFDLHADDFLVLNTNRNSPRKRLETAILAFTEFCKQQQWNPRIKLVMNAGDKAVTEAMTTHLLESVQDACRIVGVPESYMYGRLIHIRQMPRLSDTEVCMLYNACNVGINTCNGEGFGLCNLEHASLGKPQVLPLVGGLADIFDAYPRDYVLEPKTRYMISLSVEPNGGMARICDASEYANALSRIYTDYSKACQEFERRAPDLLATYDWTIILKLFNNLLSVHAPGGLKAIRVFTSTERVAELWPLQKSDTYHAYYAIGPTTSPLPDGVVGVASIADVLKLHDPDDALVITKPTQIMPFAQDHRKELYVYKYFRVQFIQNKLRFITDGLVTTVGEYRQSGDEIWKFDMVYYKGGGIMV